MTLTATEVARLLRPKRDKAMVTRGTGYNETVYHGGTSVGGNNYYDQPMNMGYHCDYIEQRWYATWWIGYFEVDSYSYYFDFSLFRCPT